MLSKWIAEDYAEAIRLDTTIPTELKRRLKVEERMPKFLKNLERELQAIPDLSRVRAKELVYDMTAYFTKLLKKYCEDRYRSDMDKYLEAQKANPPDPTEELADMGIYMEDKTVEEAKEDAITPGKKETTGCRTTKENN